MSVDFARFPSEEIQNTWNTCCTWCVKVLNGRLQHESQYLKNLGQFRSRCFHHPRQCERMRYGHCVYQGRSQLLLEKGFSQGGEGNVWKSAPFIESGANNWYVGWDDFLDIFPEMRALSPPYALLDQRRCIPQWHCNIHFLVFSLRVIGIC